MEPRANRERDRRQVADLVVLTGASAGTVFVLSDVPIVVGRSPESHLQLVDPWISSMHAMFERRGDAVWVVDLDSRNGTFVGDERVTEAAVPDGSVVRFGRTEVRLELRRTTGPIEPAGAASRAGAPQRDTLRSEGTLSTRDPRAARETEDDPYALSPRPGTVLRMAIDAAGIEDLPEARDRLRAALDGAVRATIQAGGVVGRLAGVGLIAVFGLAAPSARDASRAAAAARGARRAVRAAGGLDLRAAIDSGPILAGNAAASGLDLAALGPTAERAERLLALARPGEILAGPAVAAAAGLVPAGLRRLGDVEIEVFRDEDG